MMREELKNGPRKPFPEPFSLQAFRKAHDTRRSVLGFTLMEMLIAITLFAFAAAGSYRIFAMGIQIWKRTMGVSQGDRKAVLALEKMGRDLREAIRFEPPSEGDGLSAMKKEFEFHGKPSEYSFPSVILPDPKSPAASGGPVRMTYRFDSSRGEVCRRVETFADFYRERMPPCVAAAGHIQKFFFRYRLRNAISKSYDWYSEWDGRSELPYAVEVNMVLKPGAGQLIGRTYQKVLVIPAGGKIELKAPEAPAGGEA